MHHVARILRIDGDAAAVAAGGVIEDGAVTELFGAVVLSAAEDKGVGEKVLVNGLELGDAEAGVEPVDPGLAAVGGFVDPAAGTGVDGFGVLGMEGEGMVVGVDGLADVGERAPRQVDKGFEKREAREVNVSGSSG